MDQELQKAINTIRDHRTTQEAIKLVSYSWRKEAENHDHFVNMIIGYLLSHGGLITAEAEMIVREYKQGVTYGCGKDTKFETLIAEYTQVAK